MKPGGLPPPPYPGPASPAPSPSPAPTTPASRPPLTPTRVTSRPCTASSKTSSSTWKLSPAAPSSWPRLPSTSSTSTSSDPTPTKEAVARGRSSSSSTPASPSTSACFPPPSSTIVSIPRGDTIYPVIPTFGAGFKGELLGGPVRAGTGDVGEVSEPGVRASARRGGGLRAVPAEGGAARPLDAASGAGGGDPDRRGGERADGVEADAQPRSPGAS